MFNLFYAFVCYLRSVWYIASFFSKNDQIEKISTEEVILTMVFNSYIMHLLDTQSLYK